MDLGRSHASRPFPSPSHRPIRSGQVPEHDSKIHPKIVGQYEIHSLKVINTDHNRQQQLGLLPLWDLGHFLCRSCLVSQLEGIDGRMKRSVGPESWAGLADIP